MKRIIALAALVAVAAWSGIAASVATASVKKSGPLVTVASVIAQRPVQVVCGNKERDATFNWAWGYVWVPTSKATQMHLDSRLCGALYDLVAELQPCKGGDICHIPRYSDWWKAEAAAVITHEAFHMRRIPFNENEAMTECRAMQNYDHTLRAFGASDFVMQRLMPLMVLDHYKLAAAYPEYNRGNVRCRTPKRYDEWLSEPWHPSDG